MDETLKNYEETIDKEIACYIAKGDIDYFISLFKKFEDDETYIVTWNWWAFFFPILYFLYRKAYLHAMLMFLIRIVLIKIWFGGILLGIGAGMFANYMIYKNFTKLKAKARNQFRDEEKILEFICQEGGINKLAVVLGIFVAGANIVGILTIITSYM